MKINENKFTKIIVKVMGFMFLGIFFVFLYKNYMPRIAAFGCFDDCFNYGAGYFIAQGRMLYRDLFFNHAPLPAYISAVVQGISNPENIYELLLRHRQFVLIFSFITTVMLFIRFGWVIILFSLLYETTKFYLFGDRFLAEGMIVYPLVYLLIIAWSSLQNNKAAATGIVDSIISLLATWFILYMREPYAPAALLLLAIIVWRNKRRKLMLVTFIALTLIPLIYFPIKDIWFNLITINRLTIVADTINNSSGLLPKMIDIFLYPFLIFVKGQLSIIRYMLLALTTLLGFGIVIMCNKPYFFRTFLFFGLVLGLLNLRPVGPGAVFYGSFHLLPWYAGIICLTLLTIQNLRRYYKKTGVFFYSVILLIFGFIVWSPKIFFRENVNAQDELVTQYSREIQYSYAIEHLSAPTNTVFIDGWAELIHWKVRRPTVYKYSWYTSVMPLIPIYANARQEMFAYSPPDIYFGSCPKETNLTKLIPAEFMSDYINVPMDENPSCLWIHKNILPNISPEQWAKAQELRFGKPNKVQ